MKKKKPLISHTRLNTWTVLDSDIDIEADIHLVEHLDIKTGIKMYSLDIDDSPVITCDSMRFLEEVVNNDPCEAFEILLNVALRRGYILKSNGIKEV